MIISGPTASGKTRLSVELALSCGGEIISADSMQVYKYMDIGTAKVRPDEMKGVPHHLIDICMPDQACSIADWKNAASAAVDSILERGNIPIVVGGTNFYIHALLYDTDFDEEISDGSVRKELEREAELKGADYMYGLLKSTDPEAAESMHPNNIKRVIRALEYNRITGGLISEHNRISKEKESPYDFVYYALFRDRSVLYPDIDRRVDMMMSEGLTEEVIRLKAMGCRQDMVSMQALGYKEMLDYLDGKCSVEEAVDIIKRDTRRYAKRQYTWLNHEKDITWIDAPSDSDSFREVLERMTEKTKELKDEYFGNV